MHVNTVRLSLLLLISLRSSSRSRALLKILESAIENFWGVRNLIKDHGCMKTFFNMSKKRRSLKFGERRQRKFLWVNFFVQV